MANQNSNYIFNVFLKADFKYEFELGGITEEQKSKEFANIPIKGTLPGKNITSLNTLQMKAIEILKDAVLKVTGQHDIKKINVEFQLKSSDGETKKVKTGTDISSYF